MTTERLSMRDAPVGLGLTADAPVGIVLVREEGDVPGIGDREDAVAWIVGVARLAAGGIGHRAEASLGVVTVLHDECGSLTPQ